MQVRVRPISSEAFAPYGTYINVHEGYSEDAISFQPDRMLHYIGAPALDSLCTIRLRYRPLELTVTEYHNHCEEHFGGFAMDVLFHVALLDADGKPDLNTVTVFCLPAGGFCRVKRRVLHHAPFVMEKGQVDDGIVLLPPATYTIDCEVLNYEEAIEIIL